MAYSFEQAGKTKWRVQLNRKGIKVNKVFADELEAKNYEKKIIEEINKGIGKNSIDLENLEPDLRTLFEDYYNEIVVKKNRTHPNYLYNLRNHKARLLSTLPKVKILLTGNSIYHNNYKLNGKVFKVDKEYEIGDFIVSSIDVHVILAYIEARRNQGLSDGTINRELNYFSVAFKFIPQLYQHITYKIQNPIELITPQQYPKPSKPRKKVISEKDIELISEHLANNVKNKQHYILWYCCLSFGCRKSEGLNILWENIDWENNNIWLQYTKNGHPRNMPVNNEFLTMLKTYIGEKEKGKVFTITQYSFRAMWERTLKQLNLYDDDPSKRPIFHTLRNRFITNHLNKQNNSNIVNAENLGVSVRTLENYTEEIQLLEILKKIKSGQIPSDEELMLLVGHRGKAMTQRYYTKED